MHANGEFFTDNGLELKHRIYDTTKLVERNYYPGYSAALLRTSLNQLTLLSRQGFGVTTGVCFCVFVLFFIFLVFFNRFFLYTFHRISSKRFFSFSNHDSQSKENKQKEKKITTKQNKTKQNKQKTFENKIRTAIK
jgi:hypothetical protein